MTDDPKVTTTEEVTKEDLTDDLLDPPPRNGNITETVAKSVSSITLKKLTEKVRHLVEDRLDKDVQFYSIFTEISDLATRLHNHTSWEDKKGDWHGVKLDTEEEQLVLILVTKYWEIFDRLSDFEETLKELQDLNRVIQKIHEGRKEAAVFK